MHMRVDPAGHHIASRGVERLVAFQVRSDPGDHAVFDQYIGPVAQIGGDDGAVLDDFRHDSLLGSVQWICSTDLFNDLRRFQHGVEQHVRPRLRPVFADLLGLVVAQTVDAGAHDHRRHR